MVEATGVARHVKLLVVDVAGERREASEVHRGACNAQLLARGHVGRVGRRVAISIDVEHLVLAIV